MSVQNAISQRFAATSAPLQGALLMVGAALGMSLMTGLIRYASASLDPFQIVFFRNLFALAVMLPWLGRAGFAALHTRRFGLHFTRAAMGLLAMCAWFYAVALLPLAEAVSLNFTVPLFATAGAALILGEVVRARRWTATIVGFLGVLVITRPGMSEITWAMALPVGAAMVQASVAMVVKTLTRSEDPNAMVFYMNAFLTPMSLVPALFVWRWPSLEVLGVLALIGVLATGSHLLLTRAFARADASYVVPFQYAKLPFVAAIGFLAFGEVPDLWTWVGAAVIAGSAIYIARRESQVAKERPSHQAATGSFRERS